MPAACWAVVTALSALRQSAISCGVGPDVVGLDDELVEGPLVAAAVAVDVEVVGTLVEVVAVIVAVAVTVAVAVAVAVGAVNTGAQAVLASAWAAATAASALTVGFWPPPPPPPLGLVDGPVEVLVRLLLDVGLLDFDDDDEELDELAAVVSLARVALAWSRVAVASRTAWLSGPVFIVAST